MDLNKGVPTLFAYCEKLMWKIFFKFNQVCALRWPLVVIVSRFFYFFFRGGLWGKSLRGSLKYFMAEIFPVVWPVAVTEET